MATKAKISHLGHHRTDTPLPKPDDVQDAIKQNHLSRAAELITTIRVETREHPDRINPMDVLAIMRIANSGKLRQKARRMGEALVSEIPPSAVTARVLSEAALLAEHSGKPSHAETLHRDALRVARDFGDEAEQGARISRAYFLIRQGRPEEAFADIHGLEPASEDLHLAVVQMHASLGSIDDATVAALPDELLALVKQASEARHRDPVDRALDIARALHFAFQIRLRQERWADARGYLRAIEVTALDCSWRTTANDSRSANASSILSLAQLEYAIGVNNPNQVRAAVEHLQASRTRVHLSLGKSDPLAITLEFNEAIAQTWLSSSSRQRVSRSVSKLTEQVEKLAERVEKIQASYGTRYPEALASTGMLLAELQKDSLEPAGKIPKSGTFDTGNNRSSRARAANALLTMSKSAIVEEFGLHESDSGRTEVQIATLQKRILHITEHLARAKGDHAARRGLLMLVARRRRLLNYLFSESPARYRAIVARLGLRK